MAKDVFQKKKRITHLQTCTDDFTKGKNEDEFPGCFDYVSNIIYNVNSGFKSMNSDCSKLRAEKKYVNNDKLKNSISSVPFSTSRKGVLQNEKLGKKFTISRKFPLMEKSKKNLRQIRHNRNISKPRAHLAALPKSPVKTVILKVPDAKRIKESKKYVSGMKNNTDICSTTLSDNSMLKSNHVHNKNFKKNNEISKKIKKGEIIESTNLDIYSENKHLYDADNKLKINAGIEKNSLSGTKDSENETTDSEYERFVQKNKKGLRKKGGTKQKLSAAKKITSIKKSKRVSRKNKLKQYNSDRSDSKDDNDVPVSENFRKFNAFKKRRISQVHNEKYVDSSDEQSAYEVIPDDFTQDPSSESDVESKKTDRTQSLDAKDACSTLQKHDSDTESDATLPDVSISNKKTTETARITVDTVVLQSYEHASFDAKDLALQKPDSVLDCDTGSDATLPDVSNKKTTPETPHVTVDTVVSQSHVSDISSSLTNSSSYSGKTELNYSTSDLVIDLCSDDDSEIGVSNEYSNVSVQMEGNNTVKGELIGFSKSDDNCNNTVSKNISLVTSNQEKVLIKDAQNVSNLDSEESDIEIIEIVPTKPKDILNVTSNMLQCSNSEDTNKEKCQTVENNIVSNSNRNSELVVKTEKMYQMADIKIQNARGADSNKFEAAYMTNICSNFNQDKLVSFNQSTLINSERKELPETSSKDVLVDGSVLKKGIKQENESDDEIVMLDVVKTENISRVSSHKRVKTETPNIIVESLKCVKHSAHKILKMEIDNLSQNQYDIPQATEGININFKNEHVGENLSTLENKFQNRIDPEIKTSSSIIGEDMCSSSSAPPTIFSDIKYKENEDCIDLSKVNESHLIELFKKEFDAYQEIVQTEANVSASLKLLEVRQARKVEYIRSLVQKYVVKDKNSNAISVTKNLKDLPPSCCFPKTDISASSKSDSDIKPNISKCDKLENVQQPNVVLKHESESSQKCQNLSEVKLNKNQTLKLLHEKCNVCGKEAVAACQRCAKVFFCSNECGMKFWNDGHINECGK